MDAHYVAEKMAAAGSARGKAKALAQRECFAVILMLWNYQSCFPHEIRPFKDFDPIFQALAHIDPNKTAPSFFRNENVDSQTPKEIENTIKFITSLDVTARIMISFLFESRYCMQLISQHWNGLVLLEGWPGQMRQEYY